MHNLNLARLWGLGFLRPFSEWYSDYNVSTLLSFREALAFFPRIGCADTLIAADDFILIFVNHAAV